MSKCPWYTKDAPTGCASPKCGGHLRYADWMCEGRQRNNQTFRNCPYYANKKNYARPTGRKCPQCVIQDRGETYNAFCVSPLNPATGGGQYPTQQNARGYGICAEGRTENGCTYTQCPYYTRKKAAPKAEASREKAPRREAPQREPVRQSAGGQGGSGAPNPLGKLIKWLIILMVILMIAKRVLM